VPQSQRDNEGNYWINGKKHASVTTIINKMLPKEALNEWKNRTPNWPEIGRKARIYGLLMHQAIQNQISPIPVEMPEVPFWEWPEDAKDELEGRLEQWEKLGLVMEQPGLVEHTVVIPKAMSAGTLDWFGPTDGTLTLADFKSSAKPQKTHRIQMGAYFIGLIAEGKYAEWGQIIYLRKDSAEIVEMSQDEMYKEGEKFLDIAMKFNKMNKQSS
jgi:hypothetical protein